MRSLTLRPGDSLTILKMAVSMGFRASVSLGPAIQATGPLALAPAGLTPAERVRLRWTHDGMKPAASRSTWWHMLPHNRCPRSTPGPDLSQQGLRPGDVTVTPADIQNQLLPLLRVEGRPFGQA